MTRTILAAIFSLMFSNQVSALETGSHEVTLNIVAKGSCSQSDIRCSQATITEFDHRWVLITVSHSRGSIDFFGSHDVSRSADGAIAIPVYMIRFDGSAPEEAFGAVGGCEAVFNEDYTIWESLTCVATSDRDRSRFLNLSFAGDGSSIEHRRSPLAGLFSR